MISNLLAKISKLFNKNKRYYKDIYTRRYTTRHDEFTDRVNHSDVKYTYALNYVTQYDDDQMLLRSLQDNEFNLLEDDMLLHASSCIAHMHTFIFTDVSALCICLDCHVEKVLVVQDYYKQDDLVQEFVNLHQPI